MAIAPDALTVIATTKVADAGSYAALAFFSSEDTVANMVGAGYFNDFANMLPVGSVIIVATDTDGTPAWNMLVVSANAAGVVTVKTLLGTT